MTGSGQGCSSVVGPWPDALATFQLEFYSLTYLFFFADGIVCTKWQSGLEELYVSPLLFDTIYLF